MTRYIFFSGKGGVGKTTMASATAIHYAMEGKKTLIVTTDPASNLADVFEQEIGHKITPIKGVDNLLAMEIEPDEATREYKERIIGPYREVMPGDVIASLEENLSGPCTTEMASFDRFIDFMESDEYDVIVFDTAPTGHTIRLLELPVDWSKHIEESAKGTGQTCLGPVQTIQDSKKKYDRAAALLKDHERTNFIFVMRPEELSLYETLRASRELETIGIDSGGIVINGILPEEVCEIDFFRRKYESQQNVINEAKVAIKKPARHMLLRDNEVKGIDALKDVAHELFNGERDAGIVKSEPQARPFFEIDTPDVQKMWLPERGTKALFFTGKGGVGKTTVSCIASVYASQKGFKTLLVTTDPAAHIGEVLRVKAGSEPVKVTDNLHAVMVDQEAAFRQYKEKVLNDARGKYSDDMIAAMEEELNSPCTEEMAAFDKFIQFIESRDYDLVVFDTAPTGHTLRLLDLPFGYAKQMEMMVCGDEAKKTAQNRFREIINILRDGERTVFSLVLYPESTPILESYRAMRDLKDAGIETQLVVANMILPDGVATNEFFRNRRAMQMEHLEEIRDRFSLPVMVFPLLEEEPRGLDALRKSLSFIGYSEASNG
ncbi:MAG: TRC40/GET3/ArsA family transport-energizing ATPase [Nitrospiraceae bacterium]|nr:TRC40/GET3/ArsA family transport-energizing ATPase [Nitrospiraceae bacterium]MDA8088800.1 TRC40/GET3/ArsA family transport-energizing ATPase [Nitrospiraceae bacterium]